jgi:hypothetical protein
MAHFSRSASLAILGLVTAACAAEPITTERISQGLSVTREDDRIAGAFERDGVRVDFSSRWSDASTVALDVVIDGHKRFDLSMDYAAPLMRSDGHDNVLTDMEAVVLGDLARELGGWLVAHEAATHELLLAVSIEYWSAAPANYVHGLNVKRPDVRPLDAPVARSNNNDGITCIKKGSWYTAYYDNSAGAVTSQSAQCNANWGTSNCGSGDYSCMGRCGGGCGWGAPSSYTLDCHDHDVCSHNLCASGGGSDPHCGDEYNQAQDDWTWGVTNGCLG